MNLAKPDKALQFFLYAALGAFSIFLFLKNAWVAEDAFIILRSVDQFLHGNGFRWNPHDRTQVFTSPLWYLLIIASTALCKTLYLNLIGLSLALHIALLAVMAMLINNVWRWSAAVFLLTLSQAFFDFTASGLEYPLVFFLLGTFVLLYLRNQHVQDRLWLAVCAGLALITRHDLLFILTPMLLQLAWTYYKNLPAKSLLITLVVLLTPLAGWTLFSLIYYGVPFPNTAYAKLAITGVSELDRLRRGYIYLSVSLQTDPITPLLLAMASLHLLCDRHTPCKMLGAGILANFIYVSWIGGDYMIGRFYSPIMLAAVLGLTSSATTLPLSQRAARCLLVIPLGQLLFWLIAGNLMAFLQLLRLAGLPEPASATPILLIICTGGLLLSLVNWFSTRCANN
jgi:arabinofuranosyltransferase